MEDLARKIESEGPFERQLWKLLAWLARYGHQNMLDWLDVPISDIRRAAQALSEILQEEADAARKPME